MTLRVTLRQLEYFVAVCDCGSIASAAHRVSVSPPSISAAIAQLEAEFGLQLFVRRHAQGLSLTRSGARLLEGARETLEKAGGLTHLANEISGQVRGPLRVGCLLTFAQFVLPRLRRSFVDSYPEVEFSQTEYDQGALLKQLRAAKLDVALTYDLSVPPDLEFVPLAELPPYALFAADHPLADRPQVTIPELASHPMVLLDLPLSSDYFRSLFLDQGFTPLICEKTRDLAVMRSLVSHGFGYSLANLKPLGNLSPDGTPLRAVPLAGKVRPLWMGLLLTAGAADVRTVAAFIEHTRTHLSPMPG